MPPNRPNTARLATACISLMLACAGLGAFSACNLGLAEGAQTGKPGDTFSIPALFCGLLLGLVVALWDKLWAKFPSPLWRRFLLRSSYAGVLLVVAVLSFRADWRTAHNWTPVRIPLRFDMKNTVTATFTAEISGTYEVQIALKRNLPYKDINAFIEVWANPDKLLHGGLSPPEIVWMVNNIAGTVTTIEPYGNFSSDKVEFRVGKFEAIGGQKYTITAQVIKPSQKAQILDPHLKVDVSYIAKHLYVLADMFAEMGGAIAGILGTILMIRSFVLLRSEKKASAPNIALFP